jgi:XRE family aerobic/anaerobic benzoate catabolism transcriptional regulator
MLLVSCFTIWLKAAPHEHMQRVLAQGDHRPMADNHDAMTDLERILSARSALYARADASVDTSGQSVAQSLQSLRAVRGVQQFADADAL